MMTSNEEVRTALLEMGVEPAKCYEASTRYTNVEPAINWVFGEGESWTPQASVPSSYNPFDQHPSSGTTARHPTPDPHLGGPPPVPPAPPPRRAAGPRALPVPPPQHPKPLASNNPFRRDAAVATPVATDDEELQKALAISVQPVETDPDNIVSERSEAERSIRASAPPPSPGPNDGDLDIAPLFGPSEKNDADGKLAMVPAGTNNAEKEEEDIQRAIRESMMSASFQSTGSPTETIPPPGQKLPGAPTVFFTSTPQTYAAHMMQAIAAVPQLREVLFGLSSEETDGPELRQIQQLIVEQGISTANYVQMDRAAEKLNSAWSAYGPELPPHDTLCQHWLPGLMQQLHSAAQTRLISMADDDLSDFYQDSERLIGTRLASAPHEAHAIVRFMRSVNNATDVHGSLSSVIWGPENPAESIRALADVIFVSLRRNPGHTAPPWQLEEEVTLDRYLTSNALWAAQLRAEQGIIQGQVRRLNEEKAALSTFRGNSIPDAISTLLKHLDSTAPTDDIKTASRAELKAKLERIATTMKDRATELDTEIKEKEARASGALFETDDPQKNRYKYALRAVLWHDGFNTPGRHMYAYVKHEESWWKVTDYECEKVKWETMASDTTGQFTDGGPYLLVYSHIGPRPTGSPAVSLPSGSPTFDDSMGSSAWPSAEQSSTGMDLLDGDDIGTPTGAGVQADGAAPDPPTLAALDTGAAPPPQGATAPADYMGTSPVSPVTPTASGALVPAEQNQDSDGDVHMANQLANLP